MGFFFFLALCKELQLGPVCALTTLRYNVTEQWDANAKHKLWYREFFVKAVSFKSRSKTSGSVRCSRTGVPKSRGDIEVSKMQLIKTQSQKSNT